MAHRGCPGAEPKASLPGLCMRLRGSEIRKLACQNVYRNQGRIWQWDNEFWILQVCKRG